MQSLWKVIHSTLLAGIPLPQSSWSGSPVWLQAEKVKGMFIFVGVYFQEYYGFWLIQWSKKNNNDLICVFSVCRCMCVKIVATLLQNPKFIIYTWKTTILLVRLFTNSMTRGISSSQMQILLTCYSRLILKKTQLEEGHIYIPPIMSTKKTFIIFNRARNIFKWALL